MHHPLAGKTLHFSGMAFLVPFFLPFFPLLEIVLNFNCICTLLMSRASYQKSYRPYFRPQAGEIPSRTGTIPQSLNLPLKGMEEVAFFYLQRLIPLPKEFCQWFQNSAQKIHLYELRSNQRKRVLE